MFNKVAITFASLSLLLQGALATCPSGDYGIGVLDGASSPTGHLLVFGTGVCLDLDTNTATGSIYGTYHNGEVVSNWSGPGAPPSGFVAILTFPGGDKYTCTTSGSGGMCAGTTVDIAACCARN